MNFADKFENDIPTRKEKQDSERLCMLFTDKSGTNKNGLGIYGILLRGNSMDVLNGK